MGVVSGCRYAHGGYGQGVVSGYGQGVVSGCRCGQWM